MSTQLKSATIFYRYMYITGTRTGCWPTGLLSLTMFKQVRNLLSGERAMKPHLAKVRIFVGLNTPVEGGGEWREMRSENGWGGKGEDNRIRNTMLLSNHTTLFPFPYHILHDHEWDKPTFTRALGPAPSPVIIQPTQQNKHLPRLNPVPKNSTTLQRRQFHALLRSVLVTTWLSCMDFPFAVLYPVYDIHIVHRMPLITIVY